MRRLIAAAAALWVVTSCGALHPGTGTSPSTGTVAGRVLSYPCAPVERIDSPCPGRPVGGAKVTLAPDAGGAATTVSTGSDGHYRADVAPGRYRVSVTGRPFGQASREVDVTAGATVTADFTVDSGIR